MSQTKVGILFFVGLGLTRDRLRVAFALAALLLLQLAVADASPVYRALHGVLPGLELAWESWGTLDADRGNADRPAHIARTSPEKNFPASWRRSSRQTRMRSGDAH